MSDRTLLLGIDTSSEGDMALAQLDDGNHLRLLAQQRFSGRNQATELMPRLQALLTEVDAPLSDVNAIIIVNGPGTFTGLRLGLSAAKGLSEAMQIPLIAVSSLGYLGDARKKDTVIASIAGRTEYYLRTYAATEADPSESLEIEDALPELTRRKAVFITEPKLANKFPFAASVTLTSNGAFQAIVVALPRFLAGDFADTAALDANYVRRPYTESKAPAQAVSAETQAAPLE